MSIISSEISLYRAASWSVSPTTNGGRLSPSAIAGVSGAIFPDVYESERVAGSTVYRKAFYKVNNAANTPLVAPRAYVHGVAAGDHAVRVALGGQSDTEQDFLAGTPQWHGCAKLKNSSVAGALSLVIAAESAVPIFRVGGRVLVTSKATPSAVTGDEEIATVASVSTVGSDTTITLDVGLANGYIAASTYICSLLEPATLQASIDAPIVTAAATGTVNVGSLSANGVGSVDTTITLTFTSATAFSISNNAGITMNTTVGTVSSVTAPTGSFSAPLFSLQPSFWSGSWQAGDTVVFAIHPAAVPVWFARDIPANSTSTSSSSFSLVLDGESA